MYPSLQEKHGILNSLHPKRLQLNGRYGKITNGKPSSKQNTFRKSCTHLKVSFETLHASNGRSYQLEHSLQDEITRTITVDLSGQGDFKSIQQAIDSVPSNNQNWIRIHVKPGTYVEQIRIPYEKPKILLDGEVAASTVIQHDDGGDVTKCSTFTLLAQDFVARNLTFLNSYNLNSQAPGRAVTWAPAARLTADKAAFYGCSFMSVQDTLTDVGGRHYFESCYIEGAVDFIWGAGQSIYQNCKIKLNVAASGPTYITAQARERESDTNGFVFKQCSVEGPESLPLGMLRQAFLGRGYRNYSRVLFYNSYMSEVVAPEGWLPWGSNTQTLSFSEVGNTGPGSDMSKRVTWMKQLSEQEMNQLTDVNTFINQDGWIEKQPKI